MAFSVLHGDCRDLMARMGDSSIDSVVTDAPYELGFMGRQWDATGIANDVKMWKHVFRVLKPGGHLLSFSHARTYHRLACAVEDAGFEIRDQIMWIYGSGFPKGGVRDGKGTCLKPAHEPIVVARKPFVGPVAANQAVHGTGAINIDACRIATDEVMRAGAGVIPMRHDPTVPRGRDGEASSSKRYPANGATDFAATPGPRGGDAKGRWPANVIHDGSDEVVAGFPETKSGMFLPHHQARGKSQIGTFDIRDRTGEYHPTYGDAGSAARFFYCAKASKFDRDDGLDGFDRQSFVQFQTGNGESGKASSLSEGRDTQYRNTHPTVKPTDLMRYLVRLYTPVGGTVLDPFTGSGSTGRAAVLEGLSFVGCEMTAEYIPIALARIEAAARSAQSALSPISQLDMFSEEAA